MKSHPFLIVAYVIATAIPGAAWARDAAGATIGRTNADTTSNPDLAPAEYPDVPRSHWAYHAINTLSQAGVIEGLPDGSYGGQRPMTRYAVAVTIARLHQKLCVLPLPAEVQAQSTISSTVSGVSNVEPEHTEYPDVPGKHWAYHALAWTSRSGAIEGLPDGTFGGDKPLLRYHCAVVLARLVESVTPLSDSTARQRGVGTRAYTRSLVVGTCRISRCAPEPLGLSRCQ